MRSHEDLDQIFGSAVYEAIQYVLDGPRTWRFDLNQPEVDSDERASVGTKLQYRLIEKLGLEKLRPLDIIVVGHPVDIKGTVRSNWSVPEEAFCQLCICVRIDAAKNHHEAWLMRTHFAWLYGGAGNKDKKRGIQVGARQAYGIELYPRTQLPLNPLTLLNSEQRDAVFNLARGGQEKRLVSLFVSLPNVVIPRDAILTVCAQRRDALRRVRAVREQLRPLGIELLVGTWTGEFERAASLGFDLADEAWVGVAQSEPVPIDREQEAAVHVAADMRLF
jgi:hypothetical protein